ncbi:cell wall hydrolase [Paenibacillus selenitireducens]|uniref:Cell wall hydrolase n=1 Tax=Paenibacillus selenitireducens TaxID=1324314 RepID=A0A1T2WZ17_9BACL|nr:N-acetylmuramoyl-L-alanine amidase family protein [Paenibacillus selenitireducens]OPA72867.1 cell wall hydrolase [Paenibacillus selenitireducens]
MKKIGAVVLFCLMLFMLPSLSHANAGHQMYLNGISLAPSTEGQIIQNSTMIPIRVVVEELGFQVDWDKKTRTASIHNDKKSMMLAVDQKWATVDGKKVSLDMPPTLISDTTLVPLRFVGEQMGLVVNWENESKSVYLFTSDFGSEVTQPELPTTSPEPEQGGTTTPKDQDKNRNTNEDLNEADLENGMQVADELTEVQTVTFEDNRLVVGVSKDGLLPKSQRLSNPDRIVIDIPNAKFADQFFNSQIFGTNGQGELQVQGHAIVSKIRFSLFSNSPSTVRIVMDIKQSQSFSLYTTKDPNTIIVDLNGSTSDTGTSTGTGTAVNPPQSGKYVVVIDAGHGGSDPGTSSKNNRYEKDFNLAEALKVAELFRNDPDVEIILTRSDDTYVKRSDRVALAKQVQANLFISIHANSILNKSSITGTETYYTREDKSKAFAQVMHSHLIQGTKLPDRGVRQKSLEVTRETDMPAVLLEVGYLSNQSDEAALYTEDFQNRVAQSIKNGIRQYLGLQT